MAIKMLMRHSEVVVPVCWLMVLETMENHVFFIMVHGIAITWML